MVQIVKDKVARFAASNYNYLQYRNLGSFLKSTRKIGMVGLITLEIGVSVDKFGGVIDAQLIEYTLMAKITMMRIGL